MPRNEKPWAALLYIGLTACCWLVVVHLDRIASQRSGKADGDAALRDRVLQLVDRLDAATKQRKTRPRQA